MGTQRAVVLKGSYKGEPAEIYEIVLKEKPKVSVGEVLVNLKLRSVNPTDSFIGRFGAFQHFKPKKATVGSEGYGIVDEVGEGITRFAVGQRVIVLFVEGCYKRAEGSWQEYVSVPEKEVFAIPDTVIDEVAAQLVVNPWSIYGLLSELQIPSGEWLLQTAAGSVLARMGIKLAKHWGIKTINVVRREEQRAELIALGADEVIVSTTEDLVARVQEITSGKGAYAAIDAVGGTLYKDVVASTRKGGYIFVYGVLSGTVVTVNIFDVGKVKSRFWTLLEFIDSPEKAQAVHDEVVKLVELDVLKPPPVLATYKLDDFQQAISEADKQGRGGKILLSN